MVKLRSVIRRGGGGATLRAKKDLGVLEGLGSSLWWIMRIIGRVSGLGLRSGRLSLSRE